LLCTGVQLAACLLQAVWTERLCSGLVSYITLARCSSR
jgi:hypothetical protein